MINEEGQLVVGDKTLLAQMGHWSYDWAVFGLFRDEAGRLYTAEDSGCSCNGEWETPEYIDFNPVSTVVAAINRARKLRDANQDSYVSYSHEEFESFKQQALAVR